MNRFIFLNVRLMALLSAIACAQSVQSVIDPISINQVSVGGILGSAMTVSYQNRLKSFIVSEKSEPMTIFEKHYAETNISGDWYGEHAGKWMIAASRAAFRRNDDTLRKTVLRIANYLLSKQESSGYLGTYAVDADARFTSPKAYDRRTWDIWVHSYMILGFLEVHKYWPDKRYVEACKKIGDLFIESFEKKDRSLAMMGNHTGLSSTVILEPIVKLYQITGEKKYLSFALTVLKQMEARDGLQLVSRSIAGVDMSEVGTGKIYQICWNLLGVLRLYEVTGTESLKVAVQNAWQNIVEFHLTPMGGPWGGIARHKEVFNSKDFFSPFGLTENCSIMAWLQLNKELLKIFGDSKYGDEIERTTYNALLGAQDPNGEDWCYFTFPNGKRINTYYWACCKSSGAIGLEEISSSIYGVREKGISVNLYTQSEMTMTLPGAGSTKIRQITSYPQSDSIEIIIDPEKSFEFPLYLRVPSWAKDNSIKVNNESIPVANYLNVQKIQRVWKKGDRIIVRFPMKVMVLLKSYSVDHHGQEVVRNDYFCTTQGPLVYATGLIEGYKREDTFKLPLLLPEAQFSSTTTPVGFNGPAFQMNIPGRSPVIFLPYYEAGGRSDGKWRLTWINVAWQ